MIIQQQALDLLEEDGITSLRPYALIGNNISDIIFPNVNQLNVGCLSYSYKLTDISDIFQNVTSIPERAFNNNSILKAFKFPNATSIGISTFENDKQLQVIDSTMFPLVKTIGNYAFKNCTKLNSVIFPEVTSLGSQSFFGTNIEEITEDTFPKLTNVSSSVFQDCNNLRSFKTTSKTTSYNNSVFYNCKNLNTVDYYGNSLPTDIFFNCFSLKHLIIRSDSKLSLSGISNTNLYKNGIGAIYVQDTVIDNYLSDSNWQKYNIQPISKYPIEKYDTIDDDWETICNNENYANDYNLGDTKLLSIDGIGDFLMELVGINKDERADADVTLNNGLAKMTWINVNIISTSIFADKDKYWWNSTLKDYLNNTIYESFPDILKDSIINVKKITSYVYYYPNETSYEKIWCPSYDEVVNSSTKYAISNISKNFGINKESWWLRDRSSSYQRTITASGGNSTASNNNNYGVVFGFCIGTKVSDNQRLESLIESIKDASYKEKYKVGDLFFYNDLNGHTNIVTIIGIEKDQDINGDIIPLTLMINYIEHTDTIISQNGMGFINSNISNTILPLIEDKLPDILKSNIIATKKYTKCENIGDYIKEFKIWSPSCAELKVTGYDSYFESNYIQYDYFSNNASRIRYEPDWDTNYKKSYWLRGKGQGSQSSAITDSGGFQFNPSSTATYGVLPCFCLGDPKKHKGIKNLWDQLLADISDESNIYREKYTVGQSMYYNDTDGNFVCVEIIAIDTDKDADGNVIPITFMVKYLDDNIYSMSNTDTNTNSGGYPGSVMVTTVIQSIYNKMPSYVKNLIIPASKTSLMPDNTEDVRTYNLWLLSLKELGFNDTQETNGVVYTTALGTAAKRKKYKGIVATPYWTRTSSTTGATNFRAVTSAGAIDSKPSSTQLGVLWGFCVGKPATT